MQQSSKQLESNNYDCVVVKLRDDEAVIKMSVNKGLALMDYLTKGNAANHVQITDRDGKVTMVRTTDILRAEPISKMGSLSDHV